MRGVGVVGVNVVMKKRSDSTFQVQHTRESYHVTYHAIKKSIKSLCHRHLLLVLVPQRGQDDNRDNDPRRYDEGQATTPPSRSKRPTARIPQEDTASL